MTFIVSLKDVHSKSDHYAFILSTFCLIFPSMTKCAVTVKAVVTARLDQPEGRTLVSAIRVRVRVEAKVRVMHTMKKHNAYKSHKSFTNRPSG